MCTNKANPNNLIIIVNLYDEPIMITLDIKDDSIVWKKLALGYSAFILFGLVHSAFEVS